MSTNVFEIIVAGGGPSGCAAAIVLKQAGLNVCLINKEYNMPYKAGESIPGATMRLFKRLDIDAITDLLNDAEYRRCSANVSSWGSDDWVYSSGMLNPEGGGFHVDRVMFDKALLMKAKALGIPVYSAIIDDVVLSDNSDTRFKVSLREGEIQAVSANWLIDATGRKAVIGKKLGYKRTKVDDQMAVVNWVSVTKQDNDNSTRIKSVQEGWWYTSLLPGGKRVVSFQGLSDDIGILYRNPEMLLEKFNNEAILPYKLTTKSLLHSSAVEAGVSKPESVIYNGVLCVGDAALSFDPLSSQGIFFALYSGIKAAESVIGCLDTPLQKDSILNHYQQLIDRVFMENQKSRKYFYSTEMRYFNKPYWKARRVF